MERSIMNGGLIDQLTMEPDGVVLHVRGVGCYRLAMVAIKIPPTNYRLRIGDLIWWQGDCLRWEGKRLLRANPMPQDGMAAV